MGVVADSYMGMFLPPDIPRRITNFIAGNVRFPFVKENEIMATFYLFGKNARIKGEDETLAATDLARRTVEQLSREIRIFNNMPNKIDSDFIRENYTKRALQISIEVQNDNSFNLSDLNKRIATDPSVLSSCFVQHIAYFKQDFFFELFPPFTESQIPMSVRDKLEGRMLLLGFNLKELKLPFKNVLTQFINWMTNTG